MNEEDIKQRLDLYRQILYESVKSYKKPLTIYDIRDIIYNLSEQVYIDDKINLIPKIQPMSLQNGKVAYIVFEEDK